MSKYLIVGLGNVGNEYANTRHNIGFDVVNAFVNKHNENFRVDRLAYVAEVKWKGKQFVCICPTTYMNLSGQAVGALCRFHKISPEDLLVVQDELDLKPGSARLKLGGGTGGHNGLKDIQAHLGTPNYWRLRIGIGHPRDLAGDGRAIDVADYVLRKPLLAEQKLIETSIQNSLDCLPLFLKGDPQAAMLNLHSKD